MENYCTIYLVRHGETEWNVENRMQGHLDSALTENGIKQIEGTANKLKDIKFDAIFSSDLSRTQKTAEIIKLDRDILIQTSHLLRERSFGSFEGVLSEEYRKTVRDKLEEFQKLTEEEQWDFKMADDVETNGALVTRFLIKIREIALAYPNQNVLIASHGGIIRNFLLKIGYKKRSELRAGDFKNGSYIKFLSDGVDFVLKEVNNE